MADVDEIDWIKQYEPWKLKGYIPQEKEKEEIKELVDDDDDDDVVDLWFMKLTKINGIGKETVKDLSRIYYSEEELIESLKQDRVGLRNDVVKKLKDYFQLN